MAKLYFQLFACFCFVLKWEGNVEASDSLRCGAVKTAIKMNSTWTVRPAQKTISWRGVANAATALKSCTCNPEGGELGDVSRIQYTDSTTGAVYFNNLCLGCPGLQVPVTDFNYSVVVIDHGKSSTDTGPCSEVPVYRCRCSKPITTTKSTTKPPATTTTTTQPPPTTTTTIIAGPTTEGDDYTCSLSLPNDIFTYDCGAYNPCVADNYGYGYVYADASNTLRFRGRRGPSSYVQCSDTDDSCTEMMCSNNRIFRRSDCHCVNP